MYWYPTTPPDQYPRGGYYSWTLEDLNVRPDITAYHVSSFNYRGPFTVLLNEFDVARGGHPARGSFSESLLNWYDPDNSSNFFIGVAWPFEPGVYYAGLVYSLFNP
jgi:hypothetical protein